jgi:hypothetical protein
LLLSVLLLLLLVLLLETHQDPAHDEGALVSMDREDAEDKNGSQPWLHRPPRAGARFLAVAFAGGFLCFGNARTPFFSPLIERRLLDSRRSNTAAFLQAQLFSF